MPSPAWLPKRAFSAPALPKALSAAHRGESIDYALLARALELTREQALLLTALAWKALHGGTAESPPPASLHQAVSDLDATTLAPGTLARARLLLEPSVPTMRPEGLGEVPLSRAPTTLDRMWRAATRALTPSLDHMQLQNGNRAAAHAAALMTAVNQLGHPLLSDLEGRLLSAVEEGVEGDLAEELRLHTLEQLATSQLTLAGLSTREWQERIEALRVVPSRSGSHTQLTIWLLGLVTAMRLLTSTPSQDEIAVMTAEALAQGAATWLPVLASMQNPRPLQGRALYLKHAQPLPSALTNLSPSPLGATTSALHTIDALTPLPPGS